MTDKFSNFILSRLIKQYRKGMGLTQEGLANILGVKDTAISKYETERIKNIPLEQRIKIAVALKLPCCIVCSNDEMKLLKDFLKLESKDEI